MCFEIFNLYLLSRRRWIILVPKVFFPVWFKQKHPSASESMYISGLISVWTFKNDKNLDFNCSSFHCFVYTAGWSRLHSKWKIFKLFKWFLNTLGVILIFFLSELNVGMKDFLINILHIYTESSKKEKEEEESLRVSYREGTRDLNTWCLLYIVHKSGYR